MIRIVSILVSFVIAASGGIAQAQSRQWLGDAPFCSAQRTDCAANGMTFVREHISGDGKTCLAGIKVLCEGAGGVAIGNHGACPINAKGVKTSLMCSCTVDQLKPGSVWGTGTYTDDSSICKAALHAGVIPKAGGNVRVQIKPGLASYSGSTANGVTTQKFARWGRSFSVSK